MSVRRISAEELRGVYARCMQEPGLLEACGDVAAEKLAEALCAVHAANRAAEYVTYGDAAAFEPFDVAEGEAPEMSLKELFEVLGNFVYNCVSNGGKCFLPEEHVWVMNRVRLAIGRRSLERAARTDGTGRAPEGGT